ncbi:hypothetical protein FIBSPDRAFT_966719 [Athelia psychrophila]|uniref:Uncharacterized protein n=1 Tax=Athelia psychrophila TaxID=1759441 RepID=A0A167WI56_9AGAM|nr:hypothetical protein FIBSPDRAFT_966719 [Fibularhizoctonia sp. CBS 109695]
MPLYDIQLALDGLEEPDAISSIGQPSSPQPSPSDEDYTDNAAPLLDAYGQNSDNEDLDSTYEPDQDERMRRQYDTRRRSNEDKASQTSSFHAAVDMGDLGRI